MALQITKLPKETRDEWLTDILLEEHVHEAADLFAPQMQRGIWLHGWTRIETVAPNEYIHNRNRTRADESELWHNFVGHSFNQEKQRRMRLHQKGAKLHKGTLTLMFGRTLIGNT